MPEFPPPGIPGDPVVASQAALSDQAIDALLADFRSWLVEAARVPPIEPAVQDDSAAVDLATLVSQFVALRHEVNLQTRSSRAQQEQNSETLKQLADALELLQKPADPDAEERERADLLRPLLKTLVDAHDALALARREVLRVQENVLPILEQLTVPARPRRLTKEPVLLSWLRWLAGVKGDIGLAADQEEQERKSRQAEQAAQRIRQFLASLVTGYSMSLQRLERTLVQQGLEPIEAVGLPFDPETMEVVEVVHEPGRTASEITDEVRRGYLWQGRVFRCAQVRVARPQLSKLAPANP